MKTNGHGFIKYAAYNFRTKDPQIDQLRTKLQDQNGGKLDGSLLKRIHADGGPTVGCMRGWFFGKTRSPHNDTLEAAGRAMGLKRIWVKHNDE
jgi:hypothetical protein